MSHKSSTLLFEEVLSRVKAVCLSGRTCEGASRGVLSPSSSRLHLTTMSAGP